MRLEKRTCIAGAKGLDPWAIDALLLDVPGWTAIDGVLFREFKLPNYRATIAFANAVADIAETQNHHPEMTIDYSTCRVIWSTHSAGGALTENDFICAAKVNALYPGQASA
ncbi:4a-hydroxytetrahydrobiopterin dehydratase [Massilia sp.]|uniref:4a-hydroxytetrahydrobiopterin dehydratase n=1 Tax=Massilia sp. TaxID=1882437 RepID=UPI0028A1180D|nr:4a-hydroxytetrahydrobiopterin dehydratase [Massilia sp.]